MPKIVQKVPNPPDRPFDLDRYQKLLLLLLRRMDVSRQKQIRFHCVYKLRCGILFAFAQKRPTQRVTTIAVFDTDRNSQYVCHIQNLN